MNADLSPQDWNFDSVPDSELVACCYWEYARESAFIRDVKRRCIGPKWKKMLKPELWEFVGYDIERIQSIGYPAEVFLSGFFFDEAEDDKPRHPDAPPITGAFPKAWQELSKEERSYRAHIRSDIGALRLTPFQIGHWCFAKDLADYVESQARRMRADLPPEEGLKPIRPGLRISNAETLLVDIGWAHFTNDQIAKAFRRSLKAIRPKHMPEPDRRGHKPGDWRANLTRLAVMRLLSVFSALAIVDPRRDELPAVWKTNQFSRRKWGDVTKWHDARREAGKLFYALFPFLPQDEQPLSWQRQSAGK